MTYVNCTHFSENSVFMWDDKKGELQRGNLQWALKDG